MSTSSCRRASTGQEVYDRRRLLIERLMAVPFVAMAGAGIVGLAVLLGGAATGRYSADAVEPGPVLAAAVTIALFTVPGVIAYRPRLVADATGLHVRGLFSSRDLPWPASRGELVTVPVFGLSRTGIQAVQYRPVDGSRAVTIHALARPAVTLLRAPDAAQEATDLWDWGVSRGYAEPPAATGAATGVLPLEPVALEPVLHLRAWDTARGTFTVLLSMLGLVLAAIIITLLSPNGTVRAVGTGVALLFFGIRTVQVLALAASTTTIDAGGFHVRRFGRLGAVDAPWPRSRFDLYVLVTATGRSGSNGSCVLLLPDGRPLMLPGTSGGSGPGGALNVWETSERIWAWGVSHGVAQDDGGYRPCAKQTWETRRRLSQEHLDVERARLSSRAAPAPGSDGTA